MKLEINTPDIQRFDGFFFNPKNILSQSISDIKVICFLKNVKLTQKGKKHLKFILCLNTNCKFSVPFLGNYFPVRTQAAYLYSFDSVVKDCVCIIFITVFRCLIV